MRLHPRTMHVNAAEAEIRQALSCWESQHELRDVPDRLIALSEYQADLARRLGGLRGVFGASYPALFQVLDAARLEHDLTVVEMLQIIAGQVLTYSRSALREERFPGRSNARADVHPDDQDDEDGDEDDEDDDG